MNCAAPSPFIGVSRGAAGWLQATRTFGRGPHFCLGAPLARLQGQIAVLSILQRLPGLRVVDGSTLEQLPWGQFAGLRVLNELPVVFGEG